MSKLENRFRKLESTLSDLARQYEQRRAIETERKLVAQELVGLPYYWGEYSGVIESHSTDPTKVVAHLVSQVSNKECHWIFDSFRVLEHLAEYGGFSSWKEYHEAEKLRFAEDFESMLHKFGFTEERVNHEMRAYCSKFNVSYRSYTQEVA